MMMITIIIIIIVIMPEIMLLDKQQGQCHIIDIAVPGDACIKEKEKEKLEKYHYHMTRTAPRALSLRNY